MSLSTLFSALFSVLAAFMITAFAVYSYISAFAVYSYNSREKELAGLLQKNEQAERFRTLCEPKLDERITADCELGRLVCRVYKRNREETAINKKPEVRVVGTYKEYCK